MARLALYFGKDLKPRILNTEKVPIGHQWLIGRQTEENRPSIAFRDPTVSRQHAFIRCLDTYDREQWQIKHVGRHGTWRLLGPDRIVLPYEHWVNIREGDVFIFGLSKSGFRVSTVIDETQNDINADAEPTGDLKASSVALKPQTPFSQPKPMDRHWIADTIQVVLYGPDWCPKWLWWLTLCAFLTLFLLLHYQ